MNEFFDETAMSKKDSSKTHYIYEAALAILVFATA